jgi:hypothetical protein
MLMVGAIASHVPASFHNASARFTDVFDPVRAAPPAAPVTHLRGRE